MLRSIGKHIVHNDGMCVATVGLGCFILIPFAPVSFACAGVALIITGAGMTP